MKLFNSLTKQVEPTRPLRDDIRVYSCGPTVYDHIHIGNLSSFIFADTLHRALSASGKHVEHVMNFTDVDDKTIARSRDRYPENDPRQALKKLTEEYGTVFLEDMQAVGNDTESMTFIKATDSIEAMQDLIRQLHDHGFAYVADDGVYFSIKAYIDSGKKYGQLTEVSASTTSEARIQNDEYDKESAHDFALWKTGKPGEPTWDFELDGQTFAGRPGWHIECSAMSRKLLGQPFDIHTGGVDLIFPHHENEIAQSTAGENNPTFATMFAHNEHLLVDGQKMSKSLDNFYTLKNIMDKGFDPLAFRLLVLQAHYRTQAHFSWDNLQSAQNRLKRFRNIVSLRHQLVPQTEYAQVTAIDARMADLKDAIQDDLNTPLALEKIENLFDDLEFNGLMTGSQQHFNQWLKVVDELLGLGLEAATPDIETSQKQLIKDRETARQGHNWEESDKLRGQLKEQGIDVRDTPHGAIWTRL